MRKFLLRLPEDEYDQLKELAWQQKISMNQWIRDRIEEARPVAEPRPMWVEVPVEKPTPEELGEMFVLVDAEPEPCKTCEGRGEVFYRTGVDEYESDPCPECNIAPVDESPDGAISSDPA